MLMLKKDMARACTVRFKVCGGESCAYREDQEGIRFDEAEI
jgi:hypothetical protein